MRRLATFGVIALAALALRLLWIGHLAQTPEFTLPALDAGFHHAWASALADGDWRSPRSGQNLEGLREQPFFRPPGCAAFLAAHYRLFGTRPLPPLITQTFLGLLGLWFCFLLGNRLSRHGGAIAAVLITLAWPVLCFSGEWLDPALLFPLVPAILLALVKWRETRSLRYLAGAGLAIGVAALVRPNALVFAPVAAAWVAWQGRPGEGCAHHEDHEAHEEETASLSAPPSILRVLRVLRGEACRRNPTWLALLLLTLATLLPILPVTLRNYARTGEFVLISSNAGINFYLGNHPAATGYFTGQLGELGTYNRTDDLGPIRDRLAREMGRAALTDHAASRILGARAWAFIRGNPAFWVKLLLRKTLLFWGPREVDLNTAPETVRRDTVLRFLPVSFPILLALALAACLTSAFSVKRSALSVPSPASRTPALPNSRTLELLILAFILAWFLSILPFFVSGQYRQPILPLLALLGAPFVDRLLQAACRWHHPDPGRRTQAPGSAWKLGLGHSALGVGRWALGVYSRLLAVFGVDKARDKARDKDCPLPTAHCPLPTAHCLLLAVLLLLTHLNLAGYAPSRVLPRFNAARSAELQGRLEEALARYRAIAGLPERLGATPGEAPLQPSELAFCAQAANNLGNLLFREGKPFPAERAYRQAIRLEPGHANARANLGTALLAQGRHAEAEEVLLEVLLNDPARTYARLSLVQILLAQGRRSDAAPHLRILAADPAAADGLRQLRAQFPGLGVER